MVLPYLLTLVTLLAATVWRGSLDQRGTAVALLGNWAACTAFAHMALSDNAGTIWEVNAAIDLTSAFLLAIMSNSRPPLVICAIWGLQSIAHVAFGVMGSPEWAIRPYLLSLSWLAWGQAAFLGGWWGGLGKRLGRRRDTRRDALAPPLLPDPMAREESAQ